MKTYAGTSYSTRQDEPDEIQWQCLFLDASVNRLRGVDVVAEQAGFAHVVRLGFSLGVLRSPGGGFMNDCIPCTRCTAVVSR